MVIMKPLQPRLKTMSVLYKELAKELTVLLTDLSGVEFILADDNAPRPVGEYGTVKITTSISSDGIDEVRESDIEDSTDILSLTVGNRDMNISINVFRGDAMSTMSKIYFGILRHSSQAWMNQRSLGFVNRSVIRDLAQEIKASIEPRAQMDLLLRTTQTDSEVLESIANINIVLVAETADQQTITEIEEI